MTKRYLCLSCNNEWDTQVVNPIQCGKCRSYQLIPDDGITSLAQEALGLVETTVLGITPFLDVFVAIYRKHGFRYRAFEAMNLANKVWARMKAIRPELKKADISIARDDSKRSATD